MVQETRIEQVFADEYVQGAWGWVDGGGGGKRKERGKRGSQERWVCVVFGRGQSRGEKLLLHSLPHESFGRQSQSSAQ